ncbi:hypothetical protein D3C85_1638830 [compost metagenome]
MPRVFDVVVVDEVDLALIGHPELGREQVRLPQRHGRHGHAGHDGVVRAQAAAHVGGAGGVAERRRRFGASHDAVQLRQLFAACLGIGVCQRRLRIVA